MKLYLISNNLLLDKINYDYSVDLDIIRLSRPLSIAGENVAKKISNLKPLLEVSKIYSSYQSSALGTAKYLSNVLELPIFMNDKFNDCKVGILGSKNMKMVKGLQDHEFAYKLSNGESLIDVGDRLYKEINNILDSNEDTVIFSHKRAILGYLLKYSKVGYNLDDNLILQYNGNVIYDDSDTEYDIYEITYDNKKIISIIKL